jgi:hypothetical protein
MYTHTHLLPPSTTTDDDANTRTTSHRARGELGGFDSYFSGVGDERTLFSLSLADARVDMGFGGGQDEEREGD